MANCVASNTIDEHELDNSRIMLAKQAFYFLEQSAHASKNKQLTQSQSSISSMTSAEPTYSAGDKKMDELLASHNFLCGCIVPRNDQTAFSKTPTSVTGDAVVPEPGHMRRQSSLSPTSYSRTPAAHATTDQKSSKAQHDCLANKANRYAPFTTYSNQPTQFRNEQALWDSKEDDDTASNISFQERDYYGPQMTPQLKNEITL
ncbi:hypothetical protein BSLG_005903 [Batrachochytrium salamandrivorans]|nr:hypothetical protein BSLG_005903 [Batrachochytrium salamandrivorans]